MTQTPIRIDRSLLPYLLIGVGGVWLLIQLGILSGAMFSILFNFWPLLLLGAGLDYFTGYNRALNLPHTALAALALGVLMLVGPSLGLARGGQVTIERYTTPLELDLARGSGSSNIIIGQDSNLTLNMRTGSGSSNITLPSNTPVRVEVGESGSGSVRVGRLERVSGEGNMGVWQTAGYEAARGAKVNIIVQDRGSGSINVR